MCVVETSNALVDELLEESSPISLATATPTLIRIRITMTPKPVFTRQLKPFFDNFPLNPESVEKFCTIVASRLPGLSEDAMEFVFTNV